MKRLLFALALIGLLLNSPCFAHEPVQGTINGVLLSNGKPMPNIRISGCRELNLPRVKPCDSAFEVKTDKHGKFSFTQATGYPPCTVCRCIPGAPVACDPSWSIRFVAHIKNVKHEFVEFGMGNGIASADLECQWENPKDNTSRESNALRCNISKWVVLEEPKTPLPNKVSE